MLTLVANPSQIVTVDTRGKNIKQGKEMKQIYALEGHSLVLEDMLIKDILPNSSVNRGLFDRILDVSGKVVLPGLIDCHTHSAFAGSRADEFRLKIKGATYEEIANGGGGIIRTVNAVRNSTVEELTALLAHRINYFLSRGVTTVEVKSGYGLDLESEIKLLRAIQTVNNQSPIDLVPTFLGAHTYPPEFRGDHQKYIDIITEKMLPQIANEGLAVFCDAFCEKTAFSALETGQIFKKAQKLGFKIKLHSDQFHDIGGIETAIRYQAFSIDHLEVLDKAQIDKLAGSTIVSVLLPGVSLFLHYDYAPARAMIDAGCTVALSTDYNPGSSLIADLNLIMSLASLQMRMEIEETISAVTINAAKALDLNSDRGSIEVNKKADLAVFDAREYSDIVYQVGRNLNVMTIKNGNIIYNSI